MGQLSKELLKTNQRASGRRKRPGESRNVKRFHHIGLPKPNGIQKRLKWKESAHRGPKRMINWLNDRAIEYVRGTHFQLSIMDQLVSPSNNNGFFVSWREENIVYTYWKSVDDVISVTRFNHLNVDQHNGLVVTCNL